MPPILRHKKSLRRRVLSYQEKEDKYKKKLNQINETHDKNEVFLNAGKKMRAFIDQFNIQAKKKTANATLIDEIVKYIKIENQNW